MQYSPKLKKAMQEIQAIIKKYDIASVVILHTPGYCEHATELKPSYSAVSFDAARTKMTIKGKAVHYSGDNKKRDKALSDTANMFLLLGEEAARNGLYLLDRSADMDKVWEAEHTPGNRSSNEEQNN